MIFLKYDVIIVSDKEHGNVFCILSRLQALFQSGRSLTVRIFWAVPSVRASVRPCATPMLFEHLVDMRRVGESF